MKRIFLIAALFTFTVSAFAQSVDLRRKIEVSGSAEQEVTPDIIYVSVSLKEYMDGRNHISIDALERQLQSAVANAGVAKEDFTISNVSAYNYAQKKKNPDFLASKQYRIKLHDLNRYNQIISAVDPKAIQSTGIESYDYSKIEALKRDLKIKALLAAKEKATYLTSSIGDHVGNALDIQEVDNETFPQPVYRTMMMSKAADAEAMPPAPQDIDVKTIKLSYQIRATFELVK
ncbi:SIMPL domain-containing protein [Mucilaginibacter sp. KACC 22063]|uniref:SIMPL domain-containing protein n=1 Tax=Mucilaginibacter sp. KACC 22063 TaxID=3025666 RepID=UPI0023657B5F|nr:SIMPL domain-containing protein [Mucilaginibacter sp. KACC 22063]WDF54988.1 SIMPL domain-containing protein [Mucilaginibacter sp. KACC 22063]